MADDVSMDEAPSQTLESQDSTSAGSYLPPSIDRPALLAGKTYSYYSPIPECLKPPPGSSKDTSAPPAILGVDEAGRGPVLGPMVYSVFYLPPDLSTPLLKETHHFDDSKVLTAAVRAELFRLTCTPDSTEGSLNASCGFAVTPISARDIAAGMLAPTPYNLNAQAMDTTVALIRGVLDKGVNVREIYVDTIGSPSVYQAKLEREFPGISITVAKKADSIYPVVSAASVCAKVTRDVALEVLWEAYVDSLKAARRAAKNALSEKAVANRERSVDAMSIDQSIDGAMDDGDEEDDDFKEPNSWGSGYPSDGKCVAWLRNNMHPVFGWGPECRFSWGTAKDMLEVKGGIKVDWPADDDADTMKVTDFFRAKGDENEGDELSNWFGAPVGTECF